MKVKVKRMWKIKVNRIDLVHSRVRSGSNRG